MLKLVTRSLALAVFALATAASAQSFPDGNGTLLGGERLRVRGCGREASPISLNATLAANGNWTVVANGSTYTGTSTTRKGRLMRLTLDAGSLALLETNLEAFASDLCEETVTITSLSTRAAMKVSKRQTRARVFLRAEGAGTSASGEAGRGTYRIRARGPWTAVNA